MRERGCFSTTTLAQPRKPCRPRHPYAVPRTLFQYVCTRRRNCIGQLSPFSEYAPGTARFPERKSVNQTDPLPAVTNSVGGYPQSKGKSSAGLQGEVRSFLRLQPELDKPADGFGATCVMILAPCINLLGQSRRKADGTDRIDASGLFGATARFLVYRN
jgi:hypothetical protein